MSGSGKSTGILRAACVVLAVVLCARGAWWVWKWQQAGAAPGRLTAFAEEGAPVELAPDLESRIETFCGDCHAVPLPGSFPRDAWPREVRMGYAYYATSSRQDLDPPPMEATIAYYQQRAPVQLVFPGIEQARHDLKVSFSVERLTMDPTGGILPAVGHVTWIPLQTNGEPVLVVSDMRRGSVKSVALGSGSRKPRLLARLQNPCHVEPCDLDQDGAVDLVVADLGGFIAQDHDRGRIVWLRYRPEQDAYEQVVIASGLGRVADVRPADFDGDGDVDLLVAVFGMNLTGDIRMLWNVAEAGEPPRFEVEIIDPRPGTIHVPPCDLNGDGYLDFVALISQEHEQVAVFMNQRGSDETTASFHHQSVWEGPDLTFGSSGIDLADLDADGDLDILYTNGDAFDNSFVNPSHGIQWLENQGNLAFTYHRLADLTGAYAALPGDID
ncbi:MAG: VCBS repeat-containing protein, partial [Planctomycetes bacterium]|nr:VCBS repeat-containing protein [Planctomycetota bacterium]